MIRSKICGLKDARAVEASVSAGAAYLGFNFFPKSPRYVSPEEARALAANVPPGVAKVGLTVNATDDALDALLAAVPLDILQFHGSEPPERLAAAKARHGLPVMKALPIAEAADLEAIPAFAAVADQILLDAKPPKDAAFPGGHGVPFDWQLIAGRRFPVPWLLAGGLTPGNVAEAIARTGAMQVDVSSGVESAKGVKDAGLISAFLAAAAGADPKAAPPRLT